MTVRSIAFVSPIGQIGGAERALLDLVASLRRVEARPRVTVVLGEGGPLVDAARELGVDVEVVAMPASLQALGEAGLGAGLVARGGGLAVYVARLRRVFRDLSPDVVHTNGMKAHVLGALASARCAPVVWHVRDFVGARRWSPRVLRLLAPVARGAIAVSRAVARDVEGCGLRGRVQVVHDAVDVERFSVPGDGARAGDRLDDVGGVAPAGPGTVRVGLVAAYAAWKGHRVFLEAAARVPRALPVRFYVVGGPIYRTAGSQVSELELRGMARALGIDDRVVFVGFQPEPAWVYRALDVVVHASTSPEPFGLTIAEAMVAGRAVIASRDAGCLELVTAGEHALAVEPGRVGDLSAAIERLVLDEELRARLGDRAARRADDAFDAARLGPSVLRAYAALGVGA